MRSQAPTTLRFVPNDVETRHQRVAHRGRCRRREYERARTLDEILDDPRRPGDERAADTKRLSGRIDRREDIRLHSALFDQAAAARAADADGMRLVHDQAGAALTTDV